MSIICLPLGRDIISVYRTLPSTFLSFLAPYSFFQLFRLKQIPLQCRHEQLYLDRYGLPFCFDFWQTSYLQQWTCTNEPAHDKTYKMGFAPSEDSDQPVHPSSLIRVFAIRMKKVWVLSYPLKAQRRLWSDWAVAQVYLSLRWARKPFCRFCHALAQIQRWKEA